MRFFVIQKYSKKDFLRNYKKNMYNWPTRKKNRLNQFNYSSNWWYFLTFCTKNRIQCLWKIIDWKMILSELWKIAENEILNTAKMRKNIKIDEFVIMPDHIHLILFVGNDCIVPKNGPMQLVPTAIVPKNGSMQLVPTVIKWLKSTITKQINEKQNDFIFSWQKSYYDRIIRNEDELNRIRKYIIENPLKWDLEKKQNENLFM